MTASVKAQLNKLHQAMLEKKSLWQQNKGDRDAEKAYEEAKDAYEDLLYTVEEDLSTASKITPSERRNWTE